jgi:hypothetical protein
MVLNGELSPMQKEMALKLPPRPLTPKVRKATLTEQPLTQKDFKRKPMVTIPMLKAG